MLETVYLFLVFKRTENILKQVLEKVTRIW